MAPNPPLTVRLYVRADAYIVKRRNDLIGRLKRLDRQNRIDGVHIHLWPQAVSLDLLEMSDNLELREAVRSFEAWAERNDRELNGVFDRKEVSSSITDTDHVCRIAPVLALAEYEDAALRFVTPSSGADGQVSVLDRLAELEGRAELTPAEPLPGVREETSSHRSSPVAPN